MADSGAADQNTKEKNILGTPSNPYILNYSENTDKNEKVTASIEFNRYAFSENANIKFYCIWKEGAYIQEPYELTKGINSILHINETRYKITLTSQNVNEFYKSSVYTIQFEACKATPVDLQSDFTITVKITDTDSTGTVTLPEQSYAFKAYIKAVDASIESIQFNGDGVDNTKKKIKFEFEKDYSISSKVVVNGTDSNETFNYYAVGLPEGISMTIDGIIGGRLSNSLNKTNEDIKFTVYAVSESGHVVSQPMTYSIGEKASRGFTVSFSDNKDYATTTVNQNVTLKITPNVGSTLNNVVVSYGEEKVTLGTITGETTRPILCTGTGVLKVSVSAQVEGSNVTITKTVTVYVVGEIFDTDLDPEVSN